MSHTRETPNFRDPDAVEFCIGGNAVIVVVRHLAKIPFGRFKRRARPAVLRGVLRIDPGTPRPITRERSPRRQVDDIKKRSRIIKGVIASVAVVLRRRVLVIDRIASRDHVDVRPVREVVVELFKVCLNGTVFRGNFIFIQFKIEKRTALPVLDIRNLPFHVVRPQVVALARLDRETLVCPKLAGVSQVGVGLLVQNRFGVQGVVFTNTAGTDKRT